MNGTMFAIHTAALASFIQLYNAFGAAVGSLSEIYDRRLAKARKGVLLVRAFVASGLSFEMIIITCAVSIFGSGKVTVTIAIAKSLALPGTDEKYMWISFAKVFAQHRRRLQAVPEQTAELEEVQKDLGVLISAIAQRGTNFPVIREFLCPWSYRIRTCCSTGALR